MAKILLSFIAFVSNCAVFCNKRIDDACFEVI